LVRALHACLNTLPEHAAHQSVDNPHHPCTVPSRLLAAMIPTTFDVTDSGSPDSCGDTGAELRPGVCAQRCVCTQEFSRAKAADKDSEFWQFDVLVEACPAGCYFTPRYTAAEESSTWLNMPLTWVLSTLPVSSRAEPQRKWLCVALHGQETDPT